MKYWQMNTLATIASVIGFYGDGTMPNTLDALDNRFFVPMIAWSFVLLLTIKKRLEESRKKLT